MLIDPTGCSVPFETVAAIGPLIKGADLIINVALGTDVNRNLKLAILKETSKARQKYIEFLGGNAFFKDPAVIDLARKGQDEELRRSFRQCYQKSLSSLGYKHFSTEVVEHYYDLLFACRHPKGIEFWQKAQKYKPNKQGTFDL